PLRSQRIGETDAGLPRRGMKVSGATGVVQLAKNLGEGGVRGRGGGGVVPVEGVKPHAQIDGQVARRQRVADEAANVFLTLAIEIGPRDVRGEGIGRIVARDRQLVGVDLVARPEATVPRLERVVRPAELHLMTNGTGIEEHTPGPLNNMTVSVIVVRVIRVVPDARRVPEDLLVDAAFRIQVERDGVVSVGSRREDVRAEDLRVLDLLKMRRTALIEVGPQWMLTLRPGGQTPLLGLV